MFLIAENNSDDENAMKNKTIRKAPVPALVMGAAGDAGREQLSPDSATPVYSPRILPEITFTELAPASSLFPARRQPGQRESKQRQDKRHNIYFNKC
ncbi:hypothetical protein RRG08_010984 [Elysia crispata]|uniref:Uncharacterized protein n=1 Tax=Elysia crispata TaxID=231223 RepID=A0AAE1DK76_9GAST|nr:hypothetical protein RRG08_010984 [Elysia crispata]